MRPLVPVLALLATLLFAGCAQTALDGSTMAAASVNAPSTPPAPCASPRVAIGLDANGAPICEPPRHAGFFCPDGQAVIGFGRDGVPVCEPFARRAPQPAPAPAPEPTREVSSNLKVVGIYGYRNDTQASHLHRLSVNLELTAGAIPLDLTKLLIRASTGSAAHTYPMRWEDGAGANATWIRGSGTDLVMRPGDLVEIAFHTWPLGTELAPRQTVEIALIPETGSPIPADLKTPATYGLDKVITLR